MTLRLTCLNCGLENPIFEPICRHCGQPVDAPDGEVTGGEIGAPTLGTRLNARYRLEAVLGHGSYSVVYRATDEQLSRAVAVKVLWGTGESLLARRRFQREARLSAQLRDERVVPIFDFGVDGAYCFLVQELVEGETLRERLDRQPPSRQEAGHLFKEIAQAVAAVHAAGLIHRDLKPENVLIDARGHVRLTDFGLAREVLATELTATLRTVPESMLGTPRYMAPEQFSGLEPDVRSDVFALSAIGYELFVHRFAFEGKTIAELFYQAQFCLPEALAGGDPNLPAALAAVLKKGLLPERARRYQTIQELLEDFRQGEALAAVKHASWSRWLATGELNSRAEAAPGLRWATLVLLLLGLTRLTAVIANQIVFPEIGFVCRSQGLITRVIPGSPAFLAGIRPGMHVTEARDLEMDVRAGALDALFARAYPYSTLRLSVREIPGPPLLLRFKPTLERQEGRVFWRASVVLSALLALVAAFGLLARRRDRYALGTAWLLGGFGMLLTLIYPEGTLGPYIHFLDEGLGLLLYLAPATLVLLGGWQLPRFPLFARTHPPSIRQRVGILALALSGVAISAVLVTSDAVLALEHPWPWPQFDPNWAGVGLALLALWVAAQKAQPYWLRLACGCYAYAIGCLAVQDQIDATLRSLLRSAAYAALLVAAFALVLLAHEVAVGRSAHRLA